MLTNDVPSQNKYPSDITLYRLGRQIGKGAFGQVFEATPANREGTLDKVAIKIIDKLLVRTPDMQRRVKNEVRLHSQLHHPNILCLHHYFEDSRSVYLVMELCNGGELYGYLKKLPEGRLGESEARSIFSDICLGLQLIHSKGIIHRDLKLSNILLCRRDDYSDKMTAKIGDFGLAVVINNRVKTSISEGIAEQQTICGTPNYLAPEVVQKRPYGCEADLWSLGCLLYTMVIGRTPFEGKDIRGTFDRVRQGHFNLPTDRLSRPLCNLIKGLIEPDPDKRLSLSKVLTHPFLSQQNPPLALMSHDVPFSCRRLKPIRQQVKHGVMEILADGSCLFVLESDNSRMQVTSDGMNISLTVNGHTTRCFYHELGRAARKRYDYMKRFVDLVRSKTPRVILKTDSYRLFLFETLDDAQQIFTGKSSITKVTLTRSECLDCITIISGTMSHDYFNLDYASIDSIEDSEHRRILLDFLSRLKQLKEAARKMELENAPDSSYPLVIEEQSSLQRSSTAEKTLNSILSPIRLNGATSFDSSPLSAISSLRPNISKVFIEKVGWCLAVGPELFLLLFLDGQSLWLDGSRNRVRFDEEHRWSQIDQNLPESTKRLLIHFPDFVHKLNMK